MNTSTVVTAAPDSAPSEASSSSSDSPTPPLRDDAGNLLPQTQERPDPSSRSLRARLQLLVEAIAKDEPKLALAAFFPVEAYARVKAIAKPEQDWQRRLVGAFERSVHDYHRQLGKSADVHLQRLDIPSNRVKWMKPGSEGNRLGYFRVLHSTLVVASADGKETALELTSMISWRGEWYVVHLRGFE